MGSRSLFRSAHRSTKPVARVMQRKNYGIDQKHRKSRGAKYGVKQCANVINVIGITESSISGRRKVGEFFVK